MELLAEFFKRAEHYSLPNPPHGVKVKVEIMQRVQRRGGHLAGHEKVPQIGARKVPACVAAALRIGRRLVLGVAGVLDDEGPVAVRSWPFRAFRVGSTQSNMSMPRATHSIRSSGMPVPIRYRGRSAGQLRRGMRDDLVHHLGRLADAQAADRVGLEPDLDRRLHALGPQAGCVASLDDPELRLAGIGHA